MDSSDPGDPGRLGSPALGAALKFASFKGAVEIFTMYRLAVPVPASSPEAVHDMRSQLDPYSESAKSAIDAGGVLSGVEMARAAFNRPPVMTRPVKPGT